MIPIACVSLTVSDAYTCRWFHSRRAILRGLRPLRTRTLPTRCKAESAGLSHRQGDELRSLLVADRSRHAAASPLRGSPHHRCCYGQATVTHRRLRARRVLPVAARTSPRGRAASSWYASTCLAPSWRPRPSPKTKCRPLVFSPTTSCVRGAWLPCPRHHHPHPLPFDFPSPSPWS